MSAPVYLCLNLASVLLFLCHLTINCENSKPSNAFYPFAIWEKDWKQNSCHAKPAVALKSMIIFVSQAWISCGCSVTPVCSSVLGQGVRSLYKWGETWKKFLPNFHSAGEISWQHWPFAIIRQGSVVAFHNRGLWACKTRWPYFPLPVQRSYPPYEKTFHHKPEQLLLNHIYKYFTEAERSGGDTSDKTLNHFPLHLSHPLFTECQRVNSAGFQAFLQNIRLFEKMQIINSLSCCLANRYVVFQLFSCLVNHATGL